jgi:Protein ENHANCED DISEASE RESISTANCE 2, C-terminal
MTLSCHCHCVLLYQVSERCDHIVQHMQQLHIQDAVAAIQNSSAHEQIQQVAFSESNEHMNTVYTDTYSDKPYMLVINMQVPGNPLLSTVLYFALPSYYNCSDSAVIDDLSKQAVRYIHTH